ADFSGAHPLGEKAALCFSTKGAVESFPLTPKLRRWILQLNPGFFQTQERFKKEMLIYPERLAAFFQKEITIRTGFSASGLDTGTFQWFRPKRLEARHYFQDRVILCGDAAHVISPIGAQGMNAGFLGAARLAEIMEEHATTLKNGPHSYKARLLSRLKHCQLAQKKLVARAGKRAELHMWIGTRTSFVYSIFRKWVVRILLAKIFQPILAKRFAMLDLTSR
ncbi:MAG: FAD-dependent monooxygenase, partial [Spirochaetia bacterium]|nr:FAD-dependent monooxygenase [Spirochaetia bacterium]